MSPHVSRALAIFTILCTLPTLVVADEAEQTDSAKSLTNDDKELLDGLFKDFLFDPTGAKRVRLKVTAYDLSGGSGRVSREGWLKEATANTPGTIVFLDGETLPVTDKLKTEPVDFVATCRADLQPKKALDRDEEDRESFRPLRENSVGAIDESPLARAAWLHRLGHDELAALALQKAREHSKNAARGRGETRDDQQMVDALRSSLAWVSFAKLVHSYMAGADEVALAAGDRLLRLYPEEANEYKQAKALVADIQRRKKSGTFGKRGTLLRPADFDQWEPARKAARLIEDLDQVDARQMSQPGNVVLVMDPRVQAIIQLGDSAVPALIDAIEKDTRFTRSVHYWRDFSRDRTVLSVREAALEAVINILRTQFFATHSTGEDFTDHGDEAAKLMARQIKEYWAKYGTLPFDERMMKILTDVDSSFAAKREAASNLADLDESRRLTTSGSQITFSRRGETRKRSSPAAEKFKDPSAGEAILAAMDDDLRYHDAHPRGDLADYDRRKIEDIYLQALIDLGDKSIAAELVRRANAAKTVRDFRKYANASQQLGEPAAMKEFAARVEKGTITIPANDKPDTNPNDQPGTVELLGIVADLAKAQTPEADRALFAIAEPSHPYFEIACQNILRGAFHWSDNEGWTAHPYCLKILRRELDELAPTGSTYRIEGDQVVEDLPGGGSSIGGIPDDLQDPQSRKETVEQRQCDRAAQILAELVAGLHSYHPLQNDADERRNTMKQVFDSFPNGYRRLTDAEARLMEWYGRDALFVPKFAPLKKPATADDVKAGRAVFHLDGKGKLAKLTLPAVARLKTIESEGKQNFRQPQYLLIVQAEVDADGKTIYGVVGDGLARKATEDELTDIKSTKRSIFDIFR